MLSHLVHFIHAFMPAALIMGMLVAFWTPARNGRTLGPVSVALACGLLGGAAVYFVALRQEALTAARVSIYAAGLAAAIFNGGFLLLPEKRNRVITAAGWGTALFYSAVLTAAATFSFLALSTEESLSTTSVLNTELLLNIGGIITGALIVASLIPVIAHLGTRIGRGLIAAFAALLSLLLVLPWCAELLLGLMRLELAELTSGRLSFVAKVTKYSYVLPYVHIAIIAALALLFFRKRPSEVDHEDSGLDKAELRKARSRVLLEMRWFKAAITAACAICAVLLTYDLYASRPPRLSPAIMLTPDAAGLIKLRADDVADGNLHRFSYVTDDGHVVRFFVINSMSGSQGGRKKFGVVYDACMLCGDMGYLQNKNEVVCIACNVRMFKPTIGKEGGCNPIPLKHAIDGDSIVISARDLDSGARYFSEVVRIKVKDPVTGKELDNLKAPFKYEYKGRIYYFETEKSMEQFKASPDTYAGDQPPRYYRAQGYVKA